MVKVKICGITNKEDALLAAEAGADAIGAVVEVPVETPRKVTIAKAKEIFSCVPVFVSTVSVIMPKNIEEVANIVEELNPDIIQLQGYEPVSLVSEIHKSLGVRMIKVIHIEGKKFEGNFNKQNLNKNLNKIINEIREYKNAGICGVVLDTKTESGIGGTGKTHNWELSKILRESIDVPLILAGGLTPENVRSAIDIVKPYAVDVSSGVESFTCKKDKNKVLDFLRNAKKFNFVQSNLSEVF